MNEQYLSLLKDERHIQKSYLQEVGLVAVYSSLSLLENERIDVHRATLLM